MSYYGELRNAMEMLGEYPRSIFLGQAVREKGTGMSASFISVPREKLLEMPVMEDAQLGMSIGLALNGDLPISVFPRINFLLLAVNQLVLHLDAFPRYSAYRPRVIIRTAIGSPVPLDPGPQHTGDHSDALRMMLHTVRVVQLKEASEIVPAYRAAVEYEGGSILIEYPERYDA